VGRWRETMDAYEFHRALEAVWELLAAVDAYVNEKAPWGIAKAEGASSPRLQHVLYNCLESLRLAAVMVSPVMPAMSARLLAQLGAAAGAQSLEWGGLGTGQLLGPEGALFPRADVEAFFSEVKVDETKPVQPPSPATAASPAPTSTPAPPPVAAEQIGIDEFARVKLVVGTVKTAERVPKSKKLVRLEVDLGEAAPRQIVGGIGDRYQPEQLLGRQIVVVANLKPAVLMGVESRGMLLAASLDGAPFLLAPDGEVPPGTGVK
jgi:methionyl-tRNA synthetase